MFKDAAKFNQDISGWDVEDVEDAESMFEGASSFQTTPQIQRNGFCGSCFGQTEVTDPSALTRAGKLGYYWANNEVVVRQLRESSPNVAIDPQFL